MWNYFVIWLVTSLISYVLAPKPATEKPKGLSDIKIPTVEEGTEIPVIFGTVEVSPFVAWYGDLRTEEIKKGGKK